MALNPADVLETARLGWRNPAWFLSGSAYFCLSWWRREEGKGIWHRWSSWTGLCILQARSLWWSNVRCLNVQLHTRLLKDWRKSMIFDTRLTLTCRHPPPRHPYKVLPSFQVSSLRLAFPPFPPILPITSSVCAPRPRRTSPHSNYVYTESRSRRWGIWVILSVRLCGATEESKARRAADWYGWRCHEVTFSRWKLSWASVFYCFWDTVEKQQHWIQIRPLGWS